jgi:acyl-CoA reductase-like NAD-dependent aldehyde dehydrogenase
MGLRSFFRGRTAMAGETAVSKAVIAPAVPEPLTPEDLAELQEAWAELAEAAKDSAVKSFHACTRNGKPWQEDPASVRSMAAMLRSFPAEDSSADTKPAG